ncbi:MAG TPA: hypothetical protein VHQ65_06370 [Thermoanaerobaculia bacterium]|nr:hypothetical protein [Thermoanaerobaculia bacterium]
MKGIHQVIDYLEERSVPSALIGGLALAVHGIDRSTQDADLLALSRRVLDETFWQQWPTMPEIRRGSFDDPLAGLVRCRAAGATVEVVVGKHRWMEPMLVERIPLPLADEVVPVVRLPHLVLLKLFAGGPQDRIDVELLLGAHGGELAAQVDALIENLPTEPRRLWAEIHR